MEKIKKEIKKVIVLTTWRSGSTYFRIWLNSHSTNRIHSEIFLDNYPAQDGFRVYCEADKIRSFLFSLFSRRSLMKSKYNFVMNNIVAGFIYKLFYSQTFPGPWTDMDENGLWAQDRPKRNIEREKVIGFQLMYEQLNKYLFLQKWIANDDIYIIHLIRENSLKLLMSQKKASKTGNVHFANSKVKEKIILDPNTLIPELNEIYRRREEMKYSFPENKYIEVGYESFLNNHSHESDKIFQFLGLENASMVFSKNLKKVNPNSLKEIIQNYDEIALVLKETPYEEFLD